jgi:WD40 repeat protein
VEVSPGIGPLSCLAWDPAGARCVVAGQSGVALFVRADTRRPLVRLEAGKFPISAVQWSPDGQQIATACSDRTVKLWEVSTGRLQATLKVTTDPPDEMA